MKKIISLGISGLLCSGAFCQLSPFTAELNQELQSAVEESAAQYGIKGLSASVYISDYCYWEGASGLTIPNNLPVAPSMLFTFGSIAKTYVATIAMQLVEDGVIGLDDLIYGTLPTDLNYYSSVTVRQLMNHTSGVAEFMTIPLLENVWRSSQSINWQPLALMQNYLPQPIFIPGKDAIYSNSNYVLLGILIETITGTSIEEQFSNRISIPLNLDNTFLIPHAPVLQNWASTKIVGNRNFSAIWSTGNLGSTAREVAKFGQSLFRGEIVSNTTLNLMLEESEFGNYAQGVWKPLIGGFEAWGHNGGVDGDISEMFFFPELDITIAYSSTSPAERPANLSITSNLLTAYVENKSDSENNCLSQSNEAGVQNVSSDSEAIFTWHVGGDNLNSNRVNLVKGDFADIRSQLVIDSRDLDSTLLMYLVVRSGNVLFQKTAEGQYVDWDSSLDTLMPYTEISPETQSLEVSILNQTLDVAGEFEIYIAYSNSLGELHYSQEPIVLIIEE